MTIKHLVFSGGGPIGIVFYGALKELHKNKIWDLKNIETIYATSVGTFFALITILGYEWSWIDDFIIKRPWDKTFNLENTDYLLSIINDKGIVSNEVIMDAIKPLLLGKDLKETITLKELYEYSNIELHIFSTNINQADDFEKIDLSYKTHPNTTFIQAMMMSVTIPILFKSMCIDSKCYIDGGILNNFPLNDCLNQTSCHDDEILGFCANFKYKSDIITDETSTMQYIIYLLTNIISKMILDNIRSQKKIKNVLYIDYPNDINEKSIWIKCLTDENIRIQLINHGKNIANEFLSNLSSHSETPLSESDQV